MLINGGRIMKIAYAKSAVKYIEALDRPTKHRIRKAIEGLTDSPPKGDKICCRGIRMEEKG